MSTSVVASLVFICNIQVGLISVILSFYSAADEARQFRQVEQKKQKSMGSGDGGCLEANGWSLPPKFHTSSDGVHGASIPIPVYCRPVTDDPSVQVTDYLVF